MIERVLVTGASRGIGRAVAELLEGSGRRVATVARSGASIALDLGTIEGAARAVPAALAALGGLDAVIHCAGNADHRPLAALDPRTIDAHLAVHVRAPLILARDLAAHVAGRPGSIVLVGSTLGIQGVAGTAAYAAAKGAVHAMTRTLAIELAPAIRVNCVAPGAVDTKLIAPRAADLARVHPIGRIGTAEEIARTIVHVLDATFMTGSIVTIDGGVTAG